jgi:hypothetical protein
MWWLAILGAGLVARVVITSLRAESRFRIRLLKHGAPQILIGVALVASPFSAGVSGLLVMLALLSALGMLAAWLRARRRHGKMAP